MIAGLSGSLLSHDALRAAGFERGEAGVTGVEREVGRWHAALSRFAGPAWSARQVFDHVVVPLCGAFGFTVVPGGADRNVVHGSLQVDGVLSGVVIALPWGQDHAGSWREAVRLGMAARVRWCLSLNGASVRVFDAQRTHSRRFAEFDVPRIASDSVAFAVAWRLLSAKAFTSSALDGAVIASERHRAQIRESLQDGVHEALTSLTSAFMRAGRRRGRRAPAPATAFDESLVVIYRVLFLLFAEARGLVPTWHPVFRDSYTIEALRPAVEGRTTTAGVWDALQAIARLAHRGCRAGTLRVPPFNGRLFSPSQAPLADSLPLDETLVREALLALTTERRRDGRQRIAYADLGVEQLGGVYERVLDFEVGEPDRDGRTALVRSGQRKATGSFYTPRSLTEHLVRRTLAPLVQDATPEQVLALRIVDPAMGSGAFLVAACRYLAYAYEQALVREGAVSSMDLDDTERARFRRAVAQRCLFGVDINPMAVQLARLSLWLATLAGDRPLTFFDHHLRTGNSVVGAGLRDLIREAGRRRRPGTTLPLFDASGADRVIGAAVHSHLTLTNGLEDTLDQVRAKERLFADVHAPEGALAGWKRVVDLWCAAWFDGAPGRLHRGVFQALLDARLPPRTSAVLLAGAAAAAERQRFFHWSLEFPEAFAAADGTPLGNPGFDAVIGNPPWEMLHGPDAASLTRFSRDSGIYRLQGAGHANLFQLFVERSLALVRRGGRLGLVLPSGFATDHGCAALRRHVLDATSVDALISVENREALFPIHRGLKFLLLTTTAGGRTNALPLRVGLRHAEEFDRLPEIGSDPSAVTVTRPLLERISGEQLAIPDLRSAADVALVAKLTLAHPPAGALDGWHLEFGRELNATDDRSHFNRRRTTGALPVVEGKQLQPFTVAVEQSQQFIDRETAQTLLPTRPFEHARLAYRDVAAATNRLTLIAAVLPAGCVTTHTLFCLRTGLDDDAQQFVCGMFNSYVANYLVRLRVSTHVTVAIVQRLPLPAPPRDSRGFLEMASLARRRAVAPDAEVEAAHQAAAAELYGLTAAEFEHVLGTFPLVDRNERDRALRKFVDRIGPACPTTDSR